MTEPRRLFDEAGDDLTRQLLDAGRSGGGPSASLQAKMWSGIEASLAPIAGGAAGGATGAASGGATSAGTSLSGATAQAAAPSAAAAATPGVGLAIGTKIGLVGLFVGATLVTATVVRPPGEKPAPAAVVEQSSARVAPSSSESRDGPAPTPDHATPDYATPDPADTRPIDPRGAEQAPDSKPEVASTKPSAKQTSPPSGSAAPKASTASSLVEEVAAVQKARAALAAGNATEALAVLAELDKTIPRGSLGQERVVLTIEALAASGQKGKAGQLAKAFLAANPSSPYADRVRPYAP